MVAARLSSPPPFVPSLSPTLPLDPSLSRSQSSCICALRSEEGEVAGVVKLVQRTGSAPTSVAGKITGLSAGPHAVAVRVWGVPHDAEGAAASGGAYTGATASETVGMLGVVTASADGVAEVKFADAAVQLMGAYSIIGRSLAVFEGADASGAVLASGVVGISK